MTPPAIAVDGVRHSYGPREVLHGVACTVPAGAVTVLLGRNGAGKTTLLELIAGLRPLQAGHIEVLGSPPGAHPERVGVMLQDGGLVPGVTVTALLTAISRLYAQPQPVGGLLDGLALRHVARTPVRRLSGGEARRVALAAALMGRPDIVILDEPTTGLDVEGRDALRAVIRSLRGAGTTVLLTTHLLDEAQALADHVVIIDAGTVAAQAPLGTLLGPATATGVHLRLDAEVGADALVAALGPPIEVTRLADGRWLLTGASPDDIVPRAMRASRSLGRQVVEVHVRSRSLEDAFLEITGSA